ncbi:hypothetical protein Aaci_0184 [Alicyclobacillus acidocaldarius subsp. acidocaldarius DSM 446]|uniref:Uncharacterized protein n=1 Tax=Alicyclobacillus acidocaldarius subsp. acidocaldarius (strain ATCC 27009 / DSM 446 / BCRC 14685 / JCM 5260 / KCTC 1825 / NBRC 15652 / NCIMB 11725 / NRRL B-14509 / 104-IA) TaxID=521098 RepID=C8WQR9_ALIAD|nr:hypothetical protein Aaci_0184 [Alicyclobacillus acidocaldarius subsp. acidocaldarius DSM 446]
MRIARNGKRYRGQISERLSFAFHMRYRVRTREEAVEEIVGILERLPDVQERHLEHLERRKRELHGNRSAMEG